VWLIWGRVDRVEWVDRGEGRQKKGEEGTKLGGKECFLDGRSLKLRQAAWNTPSGLDNAEQCWTAIMPEGKSALSKLDDGFYFSRIGYEKSRSVTIGIFCFKLYQFI
jgi:hypothetical protein